MPSLHIIVNGETWMNGDLGEWQQKQPEQFVEALKNPRAARPGMMQLLTAIGECVSGSAGEFTLKRTKIGPDSYNLDLATSG
ncbi:hypothetical protein [Mycolicibacterium sp. XJ775]